MKDAPMDAYRRFARGEPGVCQETGEGGAFAFADEHEITCGFDSRYDTKCFVWLMPERGPVGPRCDRWIDQALRERRIGLHASDQGAIDVFDPAILQAAFGMGAERMASVLSLQTDADGRVGFDELASVSLHLRFVLEGWMKHGSLPLLHIVERMLRPVGRANEPEAAGRLAMLMQAALHQAGGGDTENPVQAGASAGLHEATERWVEERMRARQRREEAERCEPLLATEFAAALETLAHASD